MAEVARWRHLSLKEDLGPYAIFDPPRGLPRPWILLKAVINYPGNRDRKIDLCIKTCFKEAKIIKKTLQLSHKKAWITLTVIVNLIKYCLTKCNAIMLINKNRNKRFYRKEKKKQIKKNITVKTRLNVNVDTLVTTILKCSQIIFWKKIR